MERGRLGWWYSFEYRDKFGCKGRQFRTRDEQFWIERDRCRCRGTVSNAEGQIWMQRVRFGCRGSDLNAEGQFQMEVNFGCIISAVFIGPLRSPSRTRRNGMKGSWRRAQLGVTFLANDAARK